MVIYERLYSTVVKSLVLEPTACFYILALLLTSCVSLEIPNVRFPHPHNGVTLYNSNEGYMDKAPGTGSGIQSALYKC